MKCENCGAALKIEYNMCPNCGTPNPFAKGHRESMEKYSKAFEETRSAVIKKTNNTFGIMIKIIVCFVLIILSVVCLFMSMNVHGFITRSRINNVLLHEKEYKREAERLEEDRDYIGFSSWYDVNYLYRIDEFQEYTDVNQVFKYYSRIAQEVLGISDVENTKIAYADISGSCARIAEDIVYMRKKVKEEPKIDIYGARSEKHLKAMNDAYEEAKIIVSAIFRLNNEDIQKLDTASEAMIAVLLEESWPYGE